ncbi:thioesterase [Gordonia sp. 852002-50816_SCH5313054-c]|uniref:PaaI family thioesterase n=1 Tax=unclassified Gordonia (in: high G+C Gram-positive bacteria) TaxID=2657482 RepID=UPI0007E9EBF7|nr:MULTISPECIES: PaaI family thioesterase [unclassified Gordonia (in: high G+C Gram-positive bacteria)]OBC05418.1 thioesterase [Gordonia sp. 852002-50816_SCH5313054-a]OBC16068.1 thioesterase [Gordonia sp. 852002-50816_SCH5313054-c]
MAPTVTTSDLPTPADGSEAISLLIPRSPFVAELGLRLTDISDGHAELVMPYRPELTTVGEMVHGGAISACADIGIMAAAWAGRPIPDRLRGVTTSMSVSFINPLIADDLRIVADRLHNGNRLCHCTVDLISASAGQLVARATGAYQIG